MTAFSPGVALAEPAVLKHLLFEAEVLFPQADDPSALRQGRCNGHRARARDEVEAVTACKDRDLPLAVRNGYY